MLNKIQVLDHGYVALVETWGSDERIVEAARMSTGKGFLGWGGPCNGPAHLFAGVAVTAEGAARLDTGCPQCKGAKQTVGDEKLLKYLSDNRHDTPFEMAGLIVEVQAPIMVFREWHRHRTQSFNEMSARYAPMPDLNYIPTAERCLIGGGHLTKQAGTVAGAEVLTEQNAEHFRDALEEFYADAQSLYEAALQKGVPKELARLCLPVGRYSRMRASANLRNWLGFLTLRSDVVPSGKFAQWEIRQYANVVAGMIREAFPRTYELFVNR